MDYKIVVDSSSNLTNSYIKDENVGFEVVPLTIRINDKDYIDNDSLDVEAMLNDLKKAKGKPSSSCPSPMAFSNAFKDAKHVICITISSKLSGCFNSAFIASTEFENSKIHVIDSKLVAGSMVLIVDKAYELIKKGLSYEEICSELDNYVSSLNLLFVLDKFDNLVRNGRMSKLVAFVASSLAIKPLCIGENGEIKIYKKLRTLKIALKGLVSEMKEVAKTNDFSSKVCIISCLKEDNIGEELKKLIEETYNFKEVRIVYNHGLCAFYALQNGVIVCF